MTLNNTSFHTAQNRHISKCPTRVLQLYEYLARITHKIWTTAYDFGPHNTQRIYRCLYRMVPRETV